jgi:hypothetical protein
MTLKTKAQIKSAFQLAFTRSKAVWAAKGREMPEKGDYEFLSHGRRFLAEYGGSRLRIYEMSKCAIYTATGERVRTRVY